MANRERSKQVAREKKASLVAYKGGKCHDCAGIFPQCCYHFDHRDPSAKSFAISASIHFSLWQLMAEVDKCDLVCANCHAIRTVGNPVIAAKLRVKATGKVHSLETREKISKALRGRTNGKMTAQQRRNMSNAHLGKVLPLEQRLLMSKSQRARFMDPVQRQLLSDAQKKRWADPNERLKMSEIQKARFVN